MFSKETYINRRKRLRNELKNGILLFLGNEESPMNYADNTYHFRQDSNFLYFFGLNLPSHTGVMDLDEGKDVLFADDFTIESIVWMGTQPSMKELASKSGIGDVRPTSDLKSFIDQAIKKGRTIHFLPPYRPENMWKLHHLTGMFPEEQKQKSSVEFIKAVVAQREVKSAEEIAEIEKAVNVSVDMHIAGIKCARPGMREAEVAAEVHKVALASGGNISFPIIATINGQTLHNHYHGNTIKEGDLFLLDAGAETTMGYAGDLSSTFPVSKKFTDEQKIIYELSLKAHEAAIAMLGPGKRFKDAHLESARLIVEGMKELGLMKGNTNDAVTSGAHALFFPCGTGHMMGLDVHDMEDLGEVWVGYEGKAKSTQFGLKSLRLAKELKPGFVFTIEPGIYFIPELIDYWNEKGINKEFLNFDKINKYRNFGGIRNEEDLLVTENGSRILGKRCPKTIDEIESLRASQ